MPFDLETALQQTLSSNPNLVAFRQRRNVSAAVLAVARRFPMSLNPTISLDLRPWTFEHDSGQGSRPLDTLVSLSWMQPVELGHRTSLRTAVARAEYSRTEWEIVQAELVALVETYRRHQTGVYRQEKLRVAQRLAELYAKLVETTRRQLDAAQVTAADLVLAEVENQAMVQSLQAATQACLDAVTAFRQQLGLPEYAVSAEPAGELTLPQGPNLGSEEDLIRLAMDSHPRINAAQSQLAATHAAVSLAHSDRIPIFSVGPVFESDESGTTFYGFALSTPVPVLNSGKSMVCQRRMEYSRDLVELDQLRLQLTAQVKSSLARWTRTNDLVQRVFDSTKEIQTQADRMERLYAAGQTDLLKLLQVRQRLIEAENARLDILWQATQAYADVLAAVGGIPLLCIDQRCSIKPSPNSPATMH